MPNQPRPDNPARQVRVEDALWKSAHKIARQRGETVSGIVRAALARYVKRHGGK